MLVTRVQSAYSLWDTMTGKQLLKKPSHEGFPNFSFTPDDRNILVACGRSNEIVVIDAKTLEPIKHIPDPQTPWGIVTYPKAVGSLDRAE